MAYLNDTDAEAAMAALAAANPSSCTLLPLPNQITSGTTCHALRIGASASARTGVLIMGAMHGDEVGTADACMRFASDLLTAFASGSGITYGGKAFQADEISAIQAIDVVVMPVVNPDGLRNRRRQNPNGVDLNRSFDFLWDTTRYFHPGAYAANGASAGKYFHGAAAESELETKNVLALASNHGNIAFVLDIHTGTQSDTRMVLYSWSDDQTQTSDPAMNFANAAYDGQRGVLHDAYREYLPAGQLAASMSMAHAMAEALSGTYGEAYTASTGAGFYPNGVGGIAVDYFASRQFRTPPGRRISGFGMELPLRPTWNSQSVELIEEGAAGALALCVRVAAMEKFLTGIMSTLVRDPPLLEFFRNHLDLIHGVPRPGPPVPPLRKERAR
jgi:murein tripeptide amidase MpaA